MSKSIFLHWLLFFYIYCFLGWIIESTIVSVKQRRFVNRGFLEGPFLPIYGSGAITVLFITDPFKDNVILVYLVGMIAATILEYFTGWFMETFIKIKYWDYSNDKFNIKGRICLECSLFWGVLSIFLNFVVHPPISRLINKLSIIQIRNIVLVLTIYFICDFIYSLLNVINLNKRLSFITKLKLEKEKLMQDLKELKNASTLESASIKDKLSEITAKYNNLTNKVKFSQKQILKAYPTSLSKNFNEALKELKEKFYNK